MLELWTAGTFAGDISVMLQLTFKCVLAEVEQHNSHISSVVFIYNSSWGEHTGTSEIKMAKSWRVKIWLGFTRGEQDSQDSPPTSMKFLAARPDLGAKNENKNKIKDSYGLFI